MADPAVEPWRPAIPHFIPAEAKEFAAKRQYARETLDQLPVPSDKKYSNWERLKLADKINDLPVGGIDPTFAINQPDFDTGMKTIAIPLAKAIKDWPAQVVPYLLESALPADYHYFSALSGALFTTGTVVVVPPNVKADIEIEFSAEAGKLNAYRSIILVNPGAEVTITEKARAVLGYTSSSRPRVGARGRLSGSDSVRRNDNTVVSHGVEIYVKEGAQLDYYALQQWPETVTNLSVYRGEVGRDAALNWLIGSFGAGITQLQAESALSGEGAATNVHGVFYGTGDQHIDQTLVANHVVGHTESDTYARGLVADQSKAVYRGMIKIQPGAHGSSADQNGHAMLMGNNAHADMIPGLEIDADDVTAGHGATVGQIDDEQLFYLQSRGIKEADAREMILHGFFENLLKHITSESIRQQFWQAVDAKRHVPA